MQFSEVCREIEQHQRDVIERERREVTEEVRVELLDIVKKCQAGGSSHVYRIHRIVENRFLQSQRDLITLVNTHIMASRISLGIKEWEKLEQLFRELSAHAKRTMGTVGKANLTDEGLRMQFHELTDDVELCWRDLRLRIRANAPELPSESPGSWSDKWELQKRLGNGGQGISHLVKNRTNGELCVMKVLVDWRKNDPQSRERMNKEAEALAVLSRAGARTPKLIDAGQDLPGQERYFVMEYIPGQELDKMLMSEGPLGLEESVELARELAIEMKIFQKQGYVHRDIKPGNLMVITTGSLRTVRMIDLGISRQVNDNDGITNTHEVFGNEFIRLPELQDHETERHDIRSDLTCIVAILFFCLTAKTPVQLRDANGVSPHKKHWGSIKGRIQSAATLARLESFFDKGFSWNLRDRFQTPENLTQELMGIGRSKIPEGETDILEVAREISAMAKALSPPTPHEIQKALYERVKGALAQPFKEWRDKLRDTGLQEQSISGYGHMIPHYPREFTAWPDAEWCGMRLGATKPSDGIVVFYAIASQAERMVILLNHFFGNHDAHPKLGEWEIVSSMSVDSELEQVQSRLRSAFESRIAIVLPIIKGMLTKVDMAK